MSKSKQIIQLLSKGKSVKDIARKLKVKPQYVYTVRSIEKKKSSKIVKAVKETKAAMDAIEKKEYDKLGKTYAINLGESLKHTTSAWKQVEESYNPPVADPVNHPPHYKSGGIETIDFIEAKDLNYRLGNVVKYVSRAGKKDSDPIQDLEKAAWYLNREINVRKGA